MNLELSTFREITFSNGKIFFDNDFHFQKHFQYKNKTSKFPYYKNVLDFLQENPSVKIYFTLNDSIKPFKKIAPGYIIHMDSYVSFCDAIQNKTKGRIKAFLSQHLNLTDIYATQADKDAYIISNATQQNMISAINKLPIETQQNIVNAIKSIPTKKNPIIEPEISTEQFINLFSKFLIDKDLQNAFIENIPKVQIQILKNHYSFIKENLNKNETFIQNWIDEDEGKFRKQRCLIFGIDYVDPKREGRLSGKRFDVLAEQNRSSYVIIELKSPDAEVFDVLSKPNSNGGSNDTYHLSKELSRAIPQVLGYKRWYGKATIEEIQALGLKTKKSISRCIIVIGQSKEDEVWKANLDSLRSSLTGIEIQTYTDLLDKLNNTIQNLENNM